MSGLVWEDPPAKIYHPNATGKGKWFGILAQLRERPGEWALVAESVSNTIPSSIKRGRLGGAKPGEFETRYVGYSGNPHRAAKVYARYIGGAS